MSIGAIMEIAVGLLKAVPAVIDAVKAVEEAIPGTGNGASKLEIVKQTVLGIGKEAEELWPYLEKVVNTVVSVFNTIGVFKKDAAD